MSTWNSLHTWIKSFFSFRNLQGSYLNFENSTLPRLAIAQKSFFHLWQLEKEECSLFVNTIAPLPPVRRSLRNLQRRWAFIPDSPIEEWNRTIKKISSRNWKLIQNFFFTRLSILVQCKTKGAVRAVYALLRIARLAIRCLIANYCTRWRSNIKELSQDGGRADFSKNLPASLFNDDLSNKPNFGRIHLPGLYL
jgi:hypothetical protein